MRIALAALVFGLLAVVGIAACGGASPLPKGPAPEYEDPPAPSWLDAGDADAR